MPLLLALAVAIVLADSSVVTLALLAILHDFDSSVSAVAWVLIAFNLALAVGAVGGARLARGRARRAFMSSSVAFAVASLACAAAPSLHALVVARAAQGIVGAVVVAAALELLLASTERRRAVGLWAAAGVLGGAAGPALGGFLTEAFSWQAMFALQAPATLLALAGVVGTRSRVAAETGAVSPARPQAGGESGVASPGPLWAGGEAGGVSRAGSRVRAISGGAATGGLPGTAGTGTAVGDGVRDACPAVSPLVALALVSAALSAALFLLVVMLIEGWRLSPGEAALVVTAMPLAALVAGRWARTHHRLAPALPGSLLLAGGLAALGLLPDAGAAWTIAPQLAIGAGLGLALGALIGVTVDARGESTRALARPAAWTVAARHAGIVAGLLVLTPVFTSDLETSVDPALRAGIARLLDAPLDLEPKIALARALDAEISDAGDRQLPDVGAAFSRANLAASDRPAAARLRAGLEDELDSAATSAFSRSFLAAALLAMLAAAAVAVAAVLDRAARAGPAGAGRGRGAIDGGSHGPGATNGNRLAPVPSLNVALPAAAAVATVLVAAYVALGGARYGPTALADPCEPRARPAGVGRTQLTLLAALDGGACKLRIDREGLLLSLIAGKRPPGVSDSELGDALDAGLDRAQREGAVGGVVVFGLRLALRTGGPLALVKRLID